MGPASRFRLFPILLTTIALGTTGCAALLGTVPRHVASGAVQGGLEAMSEQQNEEMLARVLSSPEVDRATRTLVANITGGVLDGLTDSQRTEQLQAMTGTFVRTIMRSVSESLRRDLGPAIAEISREAVTSAVHAALSEASQREMAAFAGTMTRSVTSALSQSLAEGMRHDLGPAIQATLRENVGPGLSGMMNDQFNQSLGTTSRTLSRQIVLGVNDGLADVERAHGPGASSLLTHAAGAARAGIDLAAVAACALGLGVVALAFWVRKLRADARRSEAVTARQASMALMLTEAVREAEGKPWSNELQEVLRKSVRDRSTDDYLRDLLPDDAKRKAAARRENKPDDTGRPSGPLRPSYDGAE